MAAPPIARVVLYKHGVGSRSVSMFNLNAQMLAYWIEQRYLDAATEKLLRKVLERQQQAAGIEAQIARLEKERDGIHAEQKRIRENLQSLGDRPSEKDLRERFVRTLNAQEDRLEAIERELRQRHDERDRCREEIGALLAGLEYEAKISR